MTRSGGQLPLTGAAVGQPSDAHPDTQPPRSDHTATNQDPTAAAAAAEKICPSIRDEFTMGSVSGLSLSVVVFGASGDLAKVPSHVPNTRRVHRYWWHAWFRQQLAGAVPIRWHGIRPTPSRAHVSTTDCQPSTILRHSSNARAFVTLMRAKDIPPDAGDRYGRTDLVPRAQPLMHTQKKTYPALYALFSKK